MYFIIHKRRIRVKLKHHISWRQSNRFFSGTKWYWMGHWDDTQRIQNSTIVIEKSFVWWLLRFLSTLAWNRVKQLLRETSESKAVKGESLGIRPSLAGELRFVSVDLFSLGSEHHLLRMFYVVRKSFKFSDMSISLYVRCKCISLYNLYSKQYIMKDLIKNGGNRPMGNEFI